MTPVDGDGSATVEELVAWLRAQSEELLRLAFEITERVGRLDEQRPARRSPRDP
jgi:hypothetical protein